MANSIIALTACLATAIPVSITVTIPVDKGTAHIEASYPLAQPYLGIAEGAYSDGVTGGLAGFIENLKVTLADGTPVHVAGPQAGRWTLDTSAGNTVTVHYDVRLDHEKHRWPFGADEIAYNTDDSVFFISRTLLLLPPGIENARVQFIVPDAWHVATPWNAVNGEAFTYDVPDERSLKASCILVGDFIARDIRTGDTAVSLAIGRSLESYADSLESGLHACVPAYGKLFGESPQAQFLAVVNVNPIGGIADGSAYGNSISMLTPKRLEGANFDQVMYTMAHEILHLWNGNRMQPAQQMEWFREGFTDYLTWRVLTRENLIEEDTVLRELRRQISVYVNLDRNVSIADAGDRKSSNRVLVYEGGSLVAFCLDAIIQEASAGERDITDFMREMYARSAMQNSRYDEALIAAVAGEIVDTNLQPFLNQYVHGMDALPLDDSLAAFGLRADRNTSGKRISVKIVPDESVKGRIASSRDVFLGRN